MKDSFLITLDDMPSGTAQQKRYNGRTHTYFKSKSLRDAEQTFFAALYPHRPEQPSDKPIRLSVTFYFNVKDKKKWGKYKTTVPDVDNYSKAFIDQMTRCGYWKDDSQIAELYLEKRWCLKAEIHVEWEELEDD